MNLHQPQTLSRAALARDFVAIGEQRVGGEACKFFIEPKTGRGVVVSGIDLEHIARPEILAEIIFSKRKKTFSKRVFNKTMEKTCGSLWLCIGEHASSIPIDGLSDSFDDQIPESFAPLVSPHELLTFMINRMFIKNQSPPKQQVFIDSNFDNTEGSSSQCFSSGDIDNYSEAA